MTETARQKLIEYAHRFAAEYSAAADIYDDMGQERGALFVDLRQAGLTFAEIATIFGITIAAVQQRVYRAVEEAKE